MDGYILVEEGSEHSGLGSLVRQALASSRVRLASLLRKTLECGHKGRALIVSMNRLITGLIW